MNRGFTRVCVFTFSRANDRRWNEDELTQRITRSVGIRCHSTDRHGIRRFENPLLATGTMKFREADWTMLRVALSHIGRYCFVVNLLLDQNFIRVENVENDCSAIVRWWMNKWTRWMACSMEMNWRRGFMVIYRWYLDGGGLWDGEYCKIFRVGIVEMEVTSRILLLNVSKFWNCDFNFGKYNIYIYVENYGRFMEMNCAWMMLMDREE